MDCGSGFHSWSGDYGNVKGKIEIRQVQHSPAMALNRLFWENMGKHSQIQKTATSSKRRSLQIVQQKNDSGSDDQASVVPCRHHRKLNCKYETDWNWWFSEQFLQKTSGSHLLYLSRQGQQIHLPKWEWVWARYHGRKYPQWLVSIFFHMKTHHWDG